MPFDTIPEDEHEGFPCVCGEGSITKVDGVWQCDTCSFSATNTIDEDEYWERRCKECEEDDTMEIYNTCPEQTVCSFQADNLPCQPHRTT